MNKEIELKAHVDEPDALKTRLERLYGVPAEISKDDIYYIYNHDELSNKGQPVRLRAENGENTVTLKRKSVIGGIEVNDELEFRIDEGENFINFLQLTGAEKWVEKRKRGWKFTAGEKPGRPVIELCEVSGLGWFIEIEIVIESPDEKIIAEAERVILAVLKEAGIPENRIEPRYYSEMLLEKKTRPIQRTGREKEVD